MYANNPCSDMPGFSLPTIFNDPSAHPAACFLNPATTYYPFVPQISNTIVCWAYTLWSSAFHNNPPGNILTHQIEKFVYSVVVILAFETYCRGNRIPPSSSISQQLARNGIWFMMAAQAGTGAIVLPIYFACVALARSQRQYMSTAPNQAQNAWAAVLSVLFGYVLPCEYITQSDGSYHSLNIWQFFPLLVMLSHFLVAPFMKRFAVFDTAYQVPIIVTAVIGVILSARAHYDLMTSEYSYSEVFHIAFHPWTHTLASDVHTVFVLDHLFIMAATMSHLVFTAHSLVRNKRPQALLLLVLATCVVGPGGAAALVWAFCELSNGHSSQSSKRPD